MGFMDKVMSKAQEVGKAGQAKVDSVQAKRHMDDLYRQLGSLSYAARAGRERPEDAARVDQVLAKLGELEAGHPELFGATSPEADATGEVAASGGEAEPDEPVSL